MLIREKGKIHWGEHRSRFLLIILFTERTLEIRNFPQVLEDKRTKIRSGLEVHTERNVMRLRVFPSTLHFYDLISVDMVALSLIVDKECRQLKTTASRVKFDINFAFALREENSFVKRFET